MEERDSHQWCFVSGKVSVLETALLRGDFFQRFIYLKDPVEMLSCIRDSSLRDYFHTTDDLSDYEEIINRRYLEQIQEIKGVSPSPAVCDFFQLPYDFMNFKNFLKENIYGLRPTQRFPGAVGDDVWKGLWNGGYGGKKSSLPYVDVYAEAVSALKESHTKDGDTGDPGLIDNVLDGHLLYYLPALAAETKSRLIQEYVRDYQRLKGVLMLQRVPTGREAATLWFLKGDEFFERFLLGPPRHWREMLLEIMPDTVVEKIITGDRTGLLSRCEKHAGDYLMTRLEPARYTVFGPEKVFGYLSGLTAELFNLRLSIGGAINRLNPQVIKDMLRRTYV
ncbi:MAG: V-type ATPase subunit [Candidatus Brocadiales bacterium]